MTVAVLSKSFPSSIRRVNRDLRPLAAGTVTFAGGLAVANPGGSAVPAAAGYYGEATGAIGEIIVGRFYGKYGEVNNSAGGNGAAFAEIEFFRERNLYLVNNDTGAPVVAATRETMVSILNDNYATLDVAGQKADMGIFYDFSEDGTGQLWIEFPYPASAQDVGVANPNIQTGTLTLVAGTKTLAAGITVTAASKIFLQPNTPGGATQGVKYKVPTASNVVGGPGTGAFTVTAVDNTGTLVNTDTSTINYLIVG